MAGKISSPLLFTHGKWKQYFGGDTALGSLRVGLNTFADGVDTKIGGMDMKGKISTPLAGLQNIWNTYFGGKDSQGETISGSLVESVTNFVTTSLEKLQQVFPEITKVPTTSEGFIAGAEEQFGKGTKAKLEPKSKEEISNYLNERYNNDQDNTTTVNVIVEGATVAKAVVKHLGDASRKNDIATGVFTTDAEY